jgi:RNA polymerase sigma factor (sigma-70 family)
MATKSMTCVIRHLRRVVLLGDGGGLTDGQLLESFLARREDAAFEALVRRHGPMVLSVCRRVLRHTQDAEDAFQATFLVLVRKAHSIQPRELVGNWLYGVAYRTALKARTSTARRRARERQVWEMPQPEVRQETGGDWRPLLDRELNRLPDKYRTLIVLGDFEGKSRKEMARHLDLPEGTVSSRLARARRLLAKRLARHGLTLSGGALATVIAPAAEAGVPFALMTTTVEAAAQVAAGTAASASGISASVAALTEGVLTAMFLTRLKVAAALLLAAGVLGTTTGLLTHRALAQKPAAQKPAANAGKKDKKESGPSIQAHVKTVDVAGNGIVVTTSEKEKKGVEKAFSLAKDAKVILNDGRTKGDPGKEGKLADLAEGTGVVLQLSADQKTVLGITVGPASLHTYVKAVDLASNTITVAYKDSKGTPEEKTLLLDKNAKVLLNDGLVKGFKDQEGKLSDLTEGTRAVLKVSALDQKTVLEIRLEGEPLHGTVKAVDVGNNTITITVKENAGLVEKTLVLVKDARIDGNLGDIAPGTRVIVQVSVFDKTKAARVQRLEK